jgi:hypothetical protein
VADQVGVAEAALAVACTLPSAATATQRPEALHDTAFRALVVVSVVACHDETERTVGVADSQILPAESTAAHSEAVGQETAVTWVVLPSIARGDQPLVRVPGVVDTRTWPVLSAATHSVVVGHEIPFRWVVPSMGPGVHAVALAGVALE